MARKMKEIALIAFLFHLHRFTLLHAAPPIESCPYDSVQIEDTCKCDHSLCSQPPCMYELTVAVNGTDIPGNCCTIYSCEGCANDTLIDGKCPCAHGATLNSKGECKCVDPHNTLINDTCICDPNQCELPQICDKNHVPVSVDEGCCRKTKCIKCPEDSFATNNNDDAVEDKCVCYHCTVDCPPNERVVVIQPGSGFPGSCCDLYSCESEPEKRCTVEDVVYGEGETWETADAHVCKCQGGISFCSKPSDEDAASCHMEGSVYRHGESWMVDSCTNCTCVDGGPKCIAHVCEVSESRLTRPGCPQLNCTKACPEGYRVNKRGCQVCRCASAYKYDDLLHKYNITKNQLRYILEEYFARNKTEATTAVSVAAPTSTISTFIDPISITSVPYEHRTPTPTNKTDHWLIHAIVWPIVIGLLVIVILFVMVKKCRSYGSYNTNSATFYERVKLKKDTFFNNNYINKNAKGGV